MEHGKEIWIINDTNGGHLDMSFKIPHGFWVRCDTSYCYGILELSHVNFLTIDQWTLLWVYCFGEIQHAWTGPSFGQAL